MCHPPKTRVFTAHQRSFFMAAEIRKVVQINADFRKY